MSADTAQWRITDDEFEELLQLTVLNQKIEGYVLSEAEIATVRAALRKQFGLL